ncbi:MAG: hypothetical protein Q8O87_02970 [bacterium]|nr:hypothetical protein [bacterium]
MNKKKIIWTISIVAVILIAVFGFMWLQSLRGRNLMVSFTSPDDVLVGVPFVVSVNVVNDAGNILKDASLTLSLPDDVNFLGSGANKRTESIDLGNLGSGTLLKEDFQLIALGEGSTIKKIEAVVTYSPGAISSKFEKTANLDLVVKDLGLALDVSAPVKVFNGENFEIKISYRNASNIDFNDISLTINYPPTFSFKSATLKPDASNNSWQLGDLRSGSEMEFTITGTVVGPANAFFEFPAILETGFLGKRYAVSIKSAALSIAPSPLALNIVLNGNNNTIIYPGDTLVYKLNYANNTDIGLRDVIIEAQLSGSLLNLSTLITGGVLRSADNTIIWNASRVSELKSIAPGGSGSVEFRVQTGDYPIRRLSDKDFIVSVTGRIESPTVPSFVAADKIIGAAFLENKVGGGLLVDAQALFRDAASGILNQGPLPPRVGQPTNFTIHWLVSSFATDMRDIEVRAFLGGNVKFTGVVKSNTSSKPTYNDRTQEIVWRIDRVAANKGVLGEPFEAIFQVEAIPAVDQVGRYMTLMQATSASGVDEFTGAQVASSDLPLSTRLDDDSTVSDSQGIIAN